MGRDYIVCGWLTPDYRKWATKLIASLNKLNIPHDIVEITPLNGSWEEKTLAKPAQILAAMNRHPNKVIIFVDVDCEVKGDLSPLICVSGDIAFYMRSKYRRSGGLRIGARSGTLVIKPTGEAREYIREWEAAARVAPYGAVDQDPQVIAMSRAPNTSFTFIGPEWCATNGDKVSSPIILHDSASREIRKISKLRRRIWHLWNRYVYRRLAAR